MGKDKGVTWPVKKLEGYKNIMQQRVAVLEPLRIFGQGMVNILFPSTLRNFANTVDFCANDSC